MRRDRPGYVARKSKSGVAHYWIPQRAVKGAPDTLDAIRLPDDLTDAEIVRACQTRTEALRRELLTLGMGPVYDGTITSLIRIYMHDPHSPYRRVKASTRLSDYQPSLRTLEVNVGARRIDKVKASDIRGWFEKWRAKGHRKATGAIKLLRAILTYGAGERLHGCAELRAILSNMQFEQPEPRQVAMTYEQARAIIDTAIAYGRASIALTTALQFETALRRIDIIGEWEGQTWRGLQWQDIRGGVLRVRTSKTGATVAHDLSALPLVQQAMAAYPVRDIGPVIINEATGKPYPAIRYAVVFRKIRAKAKVPRGVWSMDARAGAVTETIKATGDFGDAQHLAAHADPKMTRRYVRSDGLERNQRIAADRSAQRPKQPG
jgi:hypothetical protein